VGDDEKFLAGWCESTCGNLTFRNNWCMCKSNKFVIEVFMLWLFKKIAQGIWFWGGFLMKLGGDVEDVRNVGFGFQT
jgi:hypothetical protein